MTNTSTQPDGITMSSGGVYSLATLGAKVVIDQAGRWMRDAIYQMDIREFEDGFSIADIGCADAGTSMEMVESVISAIRSRNSESQIVIYYTDQPHNDFNALIRNIHGIGDFNTYLKRYKNVYVLVSGTSLYEQMLPVGTLGLGFSATAMHWLSRKPGDIPNHVHMVGADSQEKEIFAIQAALDWRRNLLHRANELAIGGRLILINFCVDEEGRYLGNTGKVNMFDMFNSIWQRFVDDGVINEGEYEGMTLPQYYRTLAEFSAPFLDTSDPVYKSGLRLLDIETHITQCPYATEFHQHRDKQRFADAYVETIRTWNESTYLSALSPSRSMTERQSIIDAFYDCYKSHVLAEPDNHHMDYVHAFMTVERI